MSISFVIFNSFTMSFYFYFKKLCLKGEMLYTLLITYIIIIYIMVNTSYYYYYDYYICDKKHIIMFHDLR